ncbi:MAG: hypothetical protein LUG96_14415 [Tannerellaceae bacterium]|nr:hypothetical protein [Tannerellaceae bacterium]
MIGSCVTIGIIGGCTLALGYVLKPFTTFHAFLFHDYVGLAYYLSVLIIWTLFLTFVYKIGEHFFFCYRQEKEEELQKTKLNERMIWESFIHEISLEQEEKNYLYQLPDKIEELEKQLEKYKERGESILVKKESLELLISLYTVEILSKKLDTFLNDKKDILNKREILEKHLKDRGYIEEDK